MSPPPSDSASVAPACATTPAPISRPAPTPAIGAAATVSVLSPEGAAETGDPVLCDHCGRTASNGISCIGMCVADSGY